MELPVDGRYQGIQKTYTICRMRERIRKINRTFKGAKTDIAKAEAGQRPHKSFVSPRDFAFWKQIVTRTESCIKSKGQAVGERAQYLIEKKCFNEAVELGWKLRGKKTYPTELQILKELDAYERDYTEFTDILEE